MPITYIALGSNLGDRLKNIKRVEEFFKQSSDVEVISQSSVYETMPAGGPPQGLYLNSVWKCETSLNSGDLLQFLHKVENDLGRVRAEKDGPRTIDLDILDYEGMVSENPHLILPHPRIQDREFVLRPLFEIEPDWQHPQLKQSAAELWMKLKTKEDDLDHQLNKSLEAIAVS